MVTGCCAAGSLAEGRFSGSVVFWLGRSRWCGVSRVEWTVGLGGVGITPGPGPGSRPDETEEAEEIEEPGEERCRLLLL